MNSLRPYHGRVLSSTRHELQITDRSTRAVVRVFGAGIVWFSTLGIICIAIGALGS